MSPSSLHQSTDSNFGLQRKAATTINDLPSEILIKIFHCLANSVDPLPIVMEAGVSDVDNPMPESTTM
jgi:hypothetical protein